MNIELTPSEFKSLVDSFSPVKFEGVPLNENGLHPFDEALNHLHNREKLQAIKHIRFAYGLGLKEAKDVIDIFQRHYGITF